MDLTLYRIAASGRLNLAPLAEAGVEYYHAAKDSNGVITLSPVRVVSPTTRRTDATDESPNENQP